MGLLAEGEEIAAAFAGSPAINAALISRGAEGRALRNGVVRLPSRMGGAARKVEAAALLEQILDEEKAANENLTELAETRSNEEALGEEATA